MIPKTKELKDGEPCRHPGCLQHITHPCEECGRIGGVKEQPSASESEGYLWETYDEMDDYPDY